MGMERREPKGRERIEAILNILKKQAPLTLKQLSSAASVGVDRLCLKREVVLEDERPLKRSKIEKENLAFQGVRDDEDILCIKRKLKLDDDCSSKKRKMVDCSSGLTHEPPKSPTIFQKTGFSLGCINGLGKRMAKVDLVPAFPCKRVR